MQIIKKVLANFKSIKDHYNYLINKSNISESIDFNNELLIDNFNLLVCYRKDVLKNRRIIIRKFKKIDNLYNIIKSFVLENNYNINFDNLVKFLRKYQKLFLTIKMLQNGIIQLIADCREVF